MNYQELEQALIDKEYVKKENTYSKSYIPNQEIMTLELDSTPQREIEVKVEDDLEGANLIKIIISNLPIDREIPSTRNWMQRFNEKLHRTYNLSSNKCTGFSFVDTQGENIYLIMKIIKPGKKLISLKEEDYNEIISWVNKLDDMTTREEFCYNIKQLIEEAINEE